MTLRLFGILLARLLVLVALAFVGDRLLALVLRSALAHSQLRLSVAARGGQPSGVLILGDSRGVNGFYAPELKRRLDEPVFNLSYQGMSTRIEEAVLRDYLRWNPAPRLLLLEVTNVTSEQWLLDGLMCYWDVYPSLGLMADTLSRRNRIATRASHLFAFNGETILRALYYEQRSDQDQVNRYHITPGLLEATRREPDFDQPAIPENLAALRRIVRLASDRGIPVRLVVTPYLPTHVAHARNWDAWLDRIHRAAGGAEPVWDYGRAITDSTQFADRVHLNIAGCAGFIDRMLRDGMFDTRTVSALASGAYGLARAADSVHHRPVPHPQVGTP